MKLVLFLFPLSCALLSAQPELRLSTSSIGPVYIAAGQNGPTQTVTSSNIGNGTLSLSASTNQSWLSASVSGAGPVLIALNTSSLANGQYTGAVTVSDPGAIDAPQNISVTVQVGSPVPTTLDLYVAPGSSTTDMFYTAAPIEVTAKNPQSEPAVSATSFGAPLFSTVYQFNITATAPANTATGNYPATVVTSGSAVSADNKTIAVTTHVTTQPIASFLPASLTFNLAPGEPAATQAIVFSNSGQGTLTLTPGTLPSWLTASVSGSDLLFTATPGTMSPGPTTANVVVSSNAANGPFTIPVTLNVLTPGPPVASYQGVLDNALFATGAPLAPGGIVAVFGEQLADSVAPAQSLPLQTSLGGASVTVNGLAAPLYYASPGQVNFQIPYETAAGAAVVQVSRDGQTGNSVSITVQPQVPRLLPLGIGNYAIAVIGNSSTFAIPTTPGIASRPAIAGTDTVVFYALGLGQTSPAGQDGQAAPAGQVPFAQMVIGAAFGTPGAIVTPAYAGLTPGSVGLYQINVAIPANATTGSEVPVYLYLGDGVYSNILYIAIQ